MAVFPHTVIAVGDRPICVWDQELAEHNAQFCTTLDPNWFTESMSRHLEAANPDEELSQSTALSIRLTYHHALETFFAILFALIQAPECLPAWLAHYTVSDLKKLVARVKFGVPILNGWGIPQLDWAGISALIHAPTQWATEPTPGNFATAWARLASEFVDDTTRSEYNDVKHGFRASPGGGALRIGLEHEYAVAPPPEEMKLLGLHHSSRFPSRRTRSPGKRSTCI